jgi:hypothetical protein
MRSRDGAIWARSWWKAPPRRGGETALVVGLAVLVVIKGGAAASGVLSGIGRMVIDLIRL